MEKQERLEADAAKAEKKAEKKAEQEAKKKEVGLSFMQYRKERSLLTLYRLQR